MAVSVKRNMSASILVVGSGALATLFAARLSAAGYPVCMLGSWENGLRSLKENGARLITADGIEHAFPVRVTREPKDCSGVRHALVLVKTWQTERAAEQLSNCLAEDGLALTLQNGIGNRETLMRHLGRKRVAVGVTTTGATLLGPGLVRAAGEGVISLEAHARLAVLQGALVEAGFNVQTVKDAESLVWGKLIINAAINPLTALLRISNGELFSRPAALNLMRSLANEAAAVASAQGIQLPFKDAVQAVEEVVRKTADNHSSMYQDVQRGAQTEIDSICGAVTRIGEESGIATPVNRVCWQMVLACRPSSRST
jgi:2-dehydropantoate 2-reductase